MPAKGVPVQVRPSAFLLYIAPRLDQSLFWGASVCTVSYLVLCW